MSKNVVSLIGNLGTDVDLKYTAASRAVANFRMATNEKYKDKNGVIQTRTEWHRITVWGNRAENCAKYLTKGRLVSVEGTLRTSTYEKDGEKRWSTYIEARSIDFLSTGKSSDKEDMPQDNDSNDPEGVDMDVPL